MNAAVAQDVRYKFDRNADFSKFKTYKWVPSKMQRRSTTYWTNRSRMLLTQNSKKGLTKTDADTADLYIGYLAGIGTEIQFSSYNTGWGYGPGWTGGGWYGGGGGMTTGPNYYGIYEGQLAVDMNDSENHALVWRGLASKTIDPEAKPDKQQKKLAKAVAKLLKNYPPPPPTAK